MKRSSNFQVATDLFIDKTLLWIIPKSSRPNWLTYFRILTVPFIFLLLSTDHFTYALLLFAVSGLTDILDGALARRRNLVTDLGKVIDPVADKMLIGIVLFSIGFQYLVVKIFLIFIILEILAVLSGAILSFKFGRPIGANVFGKIKMTLQSVSVLTLFTGIILGRSYLILVSEYILYAGLLFAVLAGIQVYRKKHGKIKNALSGLFRTI